MLWLRVMLPLLRSSPSELLAATMQLVSETRALVTSTPSLLLPTMVVLERSILVEALPSARMPSFPLSAMRQLTTTPCPRLILTPRSSLPVIEHPRRSSLALLSVALTPSPPLV